MNKVICFLGLKSNVSFDVSLQYVNAKPKGWSYGSYTADVGLCMGTMACTLRTALSFANLERMETRVGCSVGLWL